MIKNDKLSPYRYFSIYFVDNCFNVDILAIVIVKLSGKACAGRPTSYRGSRRATKAKLDQHKHMVYSPENDLKELYTAS